MIMTKQKHTKEPVISGVKRQDMDLIIMGDRNYHQECQQGDQNGIGGRAGEGQPVNRLLKKSEIVGNAPGGVAEIILDSKGHDQQVDMRQNDEQEQPEQYRREKDNQSPSNTFFHDDATRPIVNKRAGLRFITLQNHKQKEVEYRDRWTICVRL